MTSDAKEREERDEKLRTYARLLGEANGRARLTGPTDPDVLYREHILDALNALPYIPETGRFADVGTGGGLPGLVLAICRPGLHGVLLDSVGRKAALVEEMALALGLANVEVRRMRSEDLAKAERESFDFAVARALAHSCVLAEYLSPLVKVSGEIVAFKGPKATGEVAIDPWRWKLLGLEKPKLHPYTMEGKNQFIVTWRKTKPCPAKYPRQPGLAEKKPWCVLPNMPDAQITPKTPEEIFEHERGDG